MRQVFIASAARTAIGKFQGALSSFPAAKLGAIVVREAVRRARVDPETVDEVILGQVLAAGAGQNPARQASLGAGLPDRVAALTVNKVCGSGLKAVALAAQAIRAGDAECVVAGGQESMTNAPYLLPQARAGSRLGHAQLLDSLVHDGLWDVYNDFHMGMTAELVASKYGIAREEQDRFAAASHERAIRAAKGGKFAGEIVPVEIPGKKGDRTLFAADEGPRADSSPEKLGKLAPAFKPEGGSVTAGNASPISDGAAAVVLVSEERLARTGGEPLARIAGYAMGGVAPEWVMMAPLEAAKNLEAKTGKKASEYDLVEVNEAFAVSTIALVRELRLDPERVNVHGGAVALGHPIGCSGARILVTLLAAMADRGARTGLATLCLGGGNAVALAVERS
ncbi:MAG: acetyl-CoA C-acetyltransferase [Planctomycetes bacterium]|nr:acetyl-CoA C-acetyltransferase [Planctomycetota bacterium]